MMLNVLAYGKLHDVECDAKCGVMWNVVIKCGGVMRCCGMLPCGVAM